MLKLGWFIAGGISFLVITATMGFLFLKTRAGGFSARATPSGFEEFVARTARSISLPASTREQRNPIPNSAEVLADARAHWADHCAVCHANDGSGDSVMGRQMYPPAPDMRKDATQHLTDGELFYIIENGIRFTGMPAWGSGKDTQDSWKLVHFIRHLPKLSSEEMKDMEKMNPKSPDELEEERQEEQFLRGETPAGAPQHHHH